LKILSVAKLYESGSISSARGEVAGTGMLMQRITRRARICRGSGEPQADEGFRSSVCPVIRFMKYRHRCTVMSGG
jgi:hypothetical protein